MKCFEIIDTIIKPNLMRVLLYALMLLLFSGECYSQGTITTRSFTSSSIQNNRGGEDPVRRLTIYLPPGYEKSTSKYPVLYFLHGYGTDDDQMMKWMELNKLMDEAIREGQLRPCMLVLPDSKTKYFGSFYTNSSVAGNWADFIGKDVVEYVDKNFRTIPDRESRGLFGHSMGGNGALKLAMLFADTFSVVYALSPGALHFSDDFQLGHPAFTRLLKQSNLDSLRTAASQADFDQFPFYEMLFASISRMYSPNITSGVLQADLPVKLENNKPEVIPSIVTKWEAQFPINMIKDHLKELRSLKALKMDWGRNEDFKHIPATCLAFSKKLESYGIPHFAEEYIGDHVNMLGGLEGRIYTEVFPFFEKYLKKSSGVTGQKSVMRNQAHSAF